MKIPSSCSSVFLPLVSLWLVLSGSICNGDPSPESYDKYITQTLVFIDRSASAETGPNTQALFADSLSGIVETSMSETGDRLSLFPVHHKTASKSGRWDHENELLPPQPKDFEDEKRQDTIRYKSQLAPFLEETAEQAVDHLEKPVGNGDFSRWTDLWATLGVASEEVRDNATKVQIYYFSDMFESMPGDDRRNFDREPPSNRKEAETWAKEDAERLNNYVDLKPEKLKKARIRVLLGELATKPNAQNAKFYWQKLFEEVGVPPDQVHYN